MVPKYFITGIIAFLSLNFIQAQTKFEKEYRLKNASVPAQAQQFINAISFQGKIKWYFEENNTGNSIEAKFKLDKIRHSIEFDVEGNIQDIEKEICWSEIPALAQDHIVAHLKAGFGYHKIQKIQIQYSGPSANLLNFMNKKNTENIITRYEIIVKTRLIRKVSLFEMTFDQNGQHLNTAEIQFKNTDNLEY